MCWTICQTKFAVTVKINMSKEINKVLTIGTHTYLLTNLTSVPTYLPISVHLHVYKSKYSLCEVQTATSLSNTQVPFNPTYMYNVQLYIVHSYLSSSQTLHTCTLKSVHTYTLKSHNYKGSLVTFPFQNRLHILQVQNFQLKFLFAYFFSFLPWFIEKMKIFFLFTEGK